MRSIKLTQMGGVIAICAVVGAIAGIAGSAAAPSTKSAKKSAKATSRARPHFGFRGGPGGRPAGPGGPGVHADAVVLNKAGDGFITVTSDAGKVKSVSGSDITIDESIGSVHYKDATVTIPAGATVVRNHAKAALSDIKADDFVRVISSSEETVVIAEDAAFTKQERKRFRGRGPWEHHGPPPAIAPPPSGAAPPAGGTFG